MKQNAVDAVANPQVAFIRLNVNIAGAFSGGTADHEVHKLHHWADIISGVEAHHLLDALLLQLIVSLVGAIEQIGDQFLGLLVDILSRASGITEQRINALIGRRDKPDFESSLAGNEFFNEVVLRISSSNYQFGTSEE